MSKTTLPAYRDVDEVFGKAGAGRGILLERKGTDQVRFTGEQKVNSPFASLRILRRVEKFVTGCLTWQAA
jgi:hypothetical protein